MVGYEKFIKIIEDTINRDERFQVLERDLWIGYPAAETILKRMEELYHHERRCRMPNLLIIGATNNGKTMLKEKFCKSYYLPKHVVEVEMFKRLVEMPVISIQMPVLPNIRRFLLAIGEQLEQNYELTTRNAMENDVCKVMAKMQVKMLIIDEIHNILAGGNKQQLEFLNMLRYLGNELRIPIVCIGTKDAYLALRTDPQLENRFEPCILPLWEDGKEFRALLESFVSILPLKKRSDLNNAEIANFILKKSEGILGEIAAMIKEAAKLAIRSLKEKIDLDILKQLDYKSPSERKVTFERTLS